MKIFNAGRAIGALVAAAGLLAAAGFAPAAAEPIHIVALGDSLTAGYGLSREDSFPAQLERRLRAAGHDATVVNAGVSGDTSAGGAARIEWLLSETPDLVIVELGANDGLRGLDPAATEANLDKIIRVARDAGARVLLAGMLAPPNLGRDYGAEFNAVFPDLAEAHDVVYYPFFLDGVAAESGYDIGDGLHPNAAGIAVIVERILPYVVRALEGDRS